MKFIFTENQFKKVISNFQLTEKENLINEGQNEDMALGILKKIHKDGTGNNVELSELLNKLKGLDKSENHKLLPFISIFSQYNPDLSSDEIAHTFNRALPIFKKKNIRLSFKLVGGVYEITLVMGRDEFIIEGTDWAEFKNIVSHLIYSENPENYDIKTNIPKSDLIFQNKKFEIYELHSYNVCVQYMGGQHEQDVTFKGKDIIGRKYDFCIGWANTSSHFNSYREKDENTFYAVFDMDRIYKRTEISDTKREYLDPLVCVVIMVKPNGELVAFDAKDNEDKIDEYTNTEGYLKYLTTNKVPVNRLFKVVPVELGDSAIRKLVDNYKNNELFYSLSPHDKNTYVSTYATNLTADQMKFVLNFLPPQTLENFLTLNPKLSVESFMLLPPNIKKSFLDIIISKFAGNSIIDINLFLSYLSDKTLVDYVISRFERALKGKGFSNPEKAEKIIGMISPTHFFQNMSDKERVVISSENYKLGYLPDNFGDYLKEVNELTMSKLSISNIPDSLNNMVNLKRISISECLNLKSIPNIDNLQQLTDLYIEKSPIGFLPPSIVNCTNIENLSISEAHLKELPKGMKNLTNLNILNCQNNKLQRIPEELADLPLFICTFDGNGIKSVPKVFEDKGFQPTI